MPASSCFTGYGWGSFRGLKGEMQLKFDAKQPLDLQISLRMGQAFRWEKAGEGWFSGVVQGQFIQVRKVREGLLEFRGQPGPEDAIASILKTYLRLDEGDKIAAIYADLSKRDGKIAALIAKYPGLRILRQEPWECLIAYILSAQSPIPRIERNVKALADQFGDPIAPGVHAFPKPRQLANASQEEISQELTGFHRYAISISRAAREVAEGRLDLDGLARMNYAQARQRLKRCYGVGDKVADCVLLFSLDKPKAFPIDRHIGRALVKHCFAGRQGNTPLRTLQVQGQKHFGRYAGYAGQFLFYEERPRGE